MTNHSGPPHSVATRIIFILIHPHPAAGRRNKQNTLNPAASQAGKAKNINIFEARNQRETPEASRPRHSSYLMRKHNHD
jgi:hypothetical protein